MLEVVGLKKSYGQTPALRNVSLSIPQGVCYGLLGPNGAGKTTLISIIAGTMRADAGNVTLGGALITPESYTAKRQLGYVPQELALYEDLSAEDNLRFFSILYGLSGSETEFQVGRALEVAGLEERRKGPVREFSGGMKRRLNLAAALLHQPKFLILDEPTVGVDPQSRNLIFDALEALVTQGTTILYTTHYMEEVERLCQRVAIMDGGAVVAEDEITAIKRRASTKPSVQVELSKDAGPIRDVLPGASGADSTLVIEIDDLARDLPPLLEAIAKLGGTVVDIRTQRPSLEQVFLELTGHSLRD